MESVEKQLCEDKLIAQVIQVVRKHAPDVQFKRKNFLLRTVEKLVPTFAHMTITLGNSIYFPDDFIKSKKYSVHRAATIVHETVHVLDQAEYGTFAFYFLYLFPQCLGFLSVLALGAMWNLWFLSALGFLVAFLPWGSWYRSAFELRAYTASLAVPFWVTGVYDSYEHDFVIKALSGPAYYWACRKAKDELEHEKSLVLELRDSKDSVLHLEFLKDIKRSLNGINR